MMKRKGIGFLLFTAGFLLYHYITFYLLDLIIPLDTTLLGIPLQSPNIITVILWIWGCLLIMWCAYNLLRMKKDVSKRLDKLERRLKE
jgi:hypothetical protein